MRGAVAELLIHPASLRLNHLLKFPRAVRKRSGNIGPALVNAANHLIETAHHAVLKPCDAVIQRIGDFSRPSTQRLVDFTRLGRQGVGQRGGA